MKARTYLLFTRHIFFLGTTCMMSTLYASTGKFVVGMAGYFMGALLVSGTEWVMEHR